MLDEEICDDHHVARHCTCRVIEDDYITPEAFNLRIDEKTKEPEEYLSVHWAEFFEQADLDENMRALKKAVSKQRCVKLAHLFVALNVGDIRRTVMDECGKMLAIRNIEDNKPAHTGIYGYTINDQEVEIALWEMVSPDDVYKVADDECSKP